MSNNCSQSQDYIEKLLETLQNTFFTKKKKHFSSHNYLKNYPFEYLV